MSGTERHLARPFEREVVEEALKKHGIVYKCVGREIHADCEQTGHKTHKLNPEKGVYLTSDGRGGTISALLREMNILGVRSKEEGGYVRKDDRNQKQIEDILENSVRVSTIRKDSPPQWREGKAALRKYLASRGLPFMLPAESRMAIRRDGVDLIVPLINDRDEKSIHLTALTKTGEKRPLAWLDGESRYTMGPMMAPGGSHAFAAVAPGERRQKVEGHSEIYAIGEGLESVLSGCFLSGWYGIFAVNANGMRSFLSDPDTPDAFRKKGASLAILVDRDVSGTGQIAAAHLASAAQKHGIPFLFLVPPPSVKGGKKGADWNDALQELGPERAQFAFSLAIVRSGEEFQQACDLLDHTKRGGNANVGAGIRATVR